MAAEFPDVEVKTQILVGKPFQVIMQWAEEIQPSLVIFARHGSHRVDGTDLGSQAENLMRLLPQSVLVIGTQNVKPDEIPWIEEDGNTGLEWEPAAEVRILRVPPFALGIARKAVEEYVMETYGPGGEGFGFGGRKDSSASVSASASADRVAGLEGVGRVEGAGLHTNGNEDGAYANGNGTRSPRPPHAPRPPRALKPRHSPRPRPRRRPRPHRQLRCRW
jgi:hypothetical protein